MNDVQMKELHEIVVILKQLDKNSLLLVKNGAEMLKARQEMDHDEKKTA